MAGRDAVVRSVVTVKGDRGELRQLMDLMLVEQGGGLVFDFGKILPEPAYDLQDEASDQHRWRCLKWGCKDIGRDAKILTFDEHSEDGGHMKFQFDTPWGFPYPVFQALAGKFRYLDFSCDYAEDDIGFNAGWNGYHWDHVTNRLWEDESDHEGSIGFCCRVWGINRRKYEAENAERIAEMRKQLDWGKDDDENANKGPEIYDNFGDTQGPFDYGTLADWMPSRHQNNW